MFFYIAAAILVFAGCAPQMQKPMRICPPKQTAAQSIAELANNSQNLKPIKASGTCLFRYNVSGKEYKEKFPIKLWFSPPNDIYLQGDMAFNPKGIVLGSNETEFWFSIKPEVGTYWWGRYDQVEHCFENSLLTPANLLEAFGVAAVDNPDDWTLSKDGKFDVLTKTRGKDTIVKKIYVDARDYLPRKIEYFSEDGQLAIVTELDNYKKLGEDFYLPALIKITGVAADDSEDSIKVTLKSLKMAEFSQKIFQRRPPKGFRYIKVLDADCRWTE